MPNNNPLHIHIIVGEESGDRLGASLMQALQKRLGDQVIFAGVGGVAMQAQGMNSLFPIKDIAVMGLTPVIARLPVILRRIKKTVSFVIREVPDLLVIIDSPDFTHAIAKRVRARNKDIPIINWVSPSIWAWRPGRAAAMAKYVDHVLALLPFEPEAHQRLGGPPCTYVGHPLMAQLPNLRPIDGERPSLGDETLPLLLLLPGSRQSEIDRLLDDFSAIIDKLFALEIECDVVIPAVEHLAPILRERTASWAKRPQIIVGEMNKQAVFRKAHAALATSGTVTLELALSGVPMIVMYRLDWLARQLRFLVKAWTMVLPNHIWGRPVIREFIDGFIQHEHIARALLAFLQNTPERQAQIEAFDELENLMAVGEKLPAEKTADIILQLIKYEQE